MSEDNKEVDFEGVTCCFCGIRFGMDKRVSAIWHDTHQQFHCPNGHSLVWSAETADQKELKALRVEVKDLKEKVASLQSDIEKEKKRSNDLANELEIWKPEKVITN